MKYIKVFEQFVNESEYPSGTKYKLSAQFDNDDDRDAFIDGFSLEPTEANWVDAYADKKTLKNMIEDLQKVYGLDSTKVKIQVKGGGKWEFYSLDNLPKGI